MLLDVQERFSILNLVLLERGNALTLMALRKLQSELSFAEDEQKRFGFVTKNDTVTWDVAKAEPKEVAISDRMEELIVAAFTALDEKEALTLQMLPLYQRFMGNGEE